MARSAATAQKLRACEHRYKKCEPGRVHDCCKRTSDPRRDRRHWPPHVGQGLYRGGRWQYLGAGWPGPAADNAERLEQGFPRARPTAAHRLERRRIAVTSPVDARAEAIV